MTDALPEYELFASRYATREARRADHFIGGEPHDGPMPMDYFVWVAKGPERSFVIDCGFTQETAKKRKRTFLRDPIEALELIGLDGDTVKDVILTHLHYDHVGNFHRFPAAQFHLQEPEIHYATGRPFTTAFHIGLMLEAYDTLHANAPSPQHIVPGHDPLVMKFYPPPNAELAGIVARLDVTPDDAELGKIKPQR